MMQNYKFLVLGFIFLLFTIYFLRGFKNNNLLLAEILSSLRGENSLKKDVSLFKEKFDLFEEKINQLLDTNSVLNKNFSKLEEIESLLYDLNQNIDRINQKVLANQTSTKNFKNNQTSFDKNQKEVICQNFDQLPKREVIFNEICWMGSENSSRDEWLELKNLTDKEVDLTGWQIINKDQKLKIFLEGKIFKNEFFLLERGDDDTLPDVEADLIFNGPIKNNNEIIYLFDENCNLQDIVEGIPNWPAGENKTKRTMERKIDFSWQTSEKPGGTPKAENSRGFLELIEKEKEKKELPKISLDCPTEIFSQKEFEVLFSVQGLKNNTYDLKISILKISDESEQKRTISEISLDGEEWQNSYNYLPKVFKGDSFSGKLKLRIPNDFSGEAEILVKIRDSQKRIVGEFLKKINVFTLPKFWISQTEPQKEISTSSLPENQVLTAVNLLQNEFFEEWEDNLPVGWKWGGSNSRISQSSESLVGNFSVEITVSTVDYTGFFQTGKEMNSETTYYASVWLKGRGIVKLGIKYPGSDYVYYGEETVIDSDSWVEVNVSRKPSNSGNDGGIKLNIKYNQEKGIPQNSKLIIGTAWFSTSSPPLSWPK